MRTLSTLLLLLVIGLDRVAAQEVRQLAQLSRDDETFNALENRNGWVNPEDLEPMPQCIAQQDHSTWLSTMTKCTSKQCTRHFGVICTHHQWLTELSCLSAEFSSDVVRVYYPYCSRSVLAKAQLFRWIHNITGRTWLVEVGDSNELQTLSPTSLIKGYAAIDIIDKAPTCLTDSTSATSTEPFDDIMVSCGFTSDTRHTGDAGRPWEYREFLQSMVALDSQTAGYDLTQHRIRYGHYFDKQCFCKAFGTVSESEPCSDPGLAQTKERLWLHATCGPTILPSNWKNGLRTTQYAYIPEEKWHWPKCVTAMPQQVLRLPDQCATDACEVDSRGYCKVKHAVDRACVCRDLTYNSCKGICHVFETRIDYVEWLHDLCSAVPEWNGLPKKWRQLAAPTTNDMIPWRWNMKSTKHSNSTQTCASNDGKVGSIALINAITLVAGFIGPRPRHSLIAQHLSQSWVSTGLVITALHLLANWFNSIIIQSSLGFEDVPILQMVFLWSSMPRSTWSTVLIVGARSLRAESLLPTLASCLLAETILQTLSARYMLATVDYGREHSFYGNGMAKLETSSSAQHMYAGALMWLLVVVIAACLLIYEVCQRTMIDSNVSEPQTRKSPTPTPTEYPTTPSSGSQTLFEEDAAWSHKDRSWHTEQTPLSSTGRTYTSYGTVRTENRHTLDEEKGAWRIFLIIVSSMILLWIAQWLFWAGFLGLSSDEFCPPNLGLLTVMWIAASLAVGCVTLFPQSPRV